MSKYFTRDTVEGITIPENWKKLKNFQTVRPLTLEQQIERFQAAGRKLNELAGLGVYDFNENQPLDDELEDPTRDPDYDIIDAAVAARDLQLKAEIQSSQEDGTDTQSQGKVSENGSVDSSSEVKDNGAPPEAARSDANPDK